MLTATEAAQRLGITARSVTRLTTVLKGRKATTEELANLIRAGRIQSIPPSGIRVFDELEVERYLQERRLRGRPRKRGRDDSLHSDT